MASVAKAPVAPGKVAKDEKIVDFSVDDLRAPFLLRCAAICIDYMLLIVFPAAWLTLGQFFGDGGLPSIGLTVWIVGIVFFLGNAVVLPIFRGQSIGKMITGITIVNLDGTRVGAGRIILRNTAGYLITLLTAGIGFFISVVNPSGRALHDMFAGSVVIRGSRQQV